jgi:hypothetical protein
MKHSSLRIRFGRTDLQVQRVGGRPLPDDVDTEIWSILRRFPFSSAPATADAISIPTSTIHWSIREWMAPQRNPTARGRANCNSYGQILQCVQKPLPCLSSLVTRHALGFFIIGCPLKLYPNMFAIA